MDSKLEETQSENSCDTIQIEHDESDIHLLETISTLIREQFDYIEELENVNFNKTLVMENLKSAIEYNKLLKETTEKVCLYS